MALSLSAPSSGSDLAATLEELWSASAAKKSVDLSYFSPRSGKVTQRKVDPYGLALRRGIWTLVGYCHLRQGIRTFHVHRVQGLTVNASRPRSPDFTVPADFRLDAYVAAHPWQHRFHEPVAVTIALYGELAPLASRLFPDAQVDAKADEPKDKAEVTVAVTYLDGLVRYALSLGPSAKVLFPNEAVERWQQMAARVLSLHQLPRKAASGEG
jgi:proteasome accessory factor B